MTSPLRAGRRLLRLVAAIALVSAVACGGDDGGGEEGADEGENAGASAETVSASEFANTVCSEVGQWFQSIQTQTEELSSATADLEGDLEGAKESIQRYLDEVIVATDDLLTGVRGAGEPDVEDGREVAAELQAGFERVRAEFEEASGEIEAVSTDDPDTFVAEFDRIGGRLQDGSAIEEAFSGLERFSDNEELDRAFDEEEACQQIGG